MGGVDFLCPPPPFQHSTAPPAMSPWGHSGGWGPPVLPHGGTLPSPAAARGGRAGGRRNAGKSGLPATARGLGGGGRHRAPAPQRGGPQADRGVPGQGGHARHMLSRVGGVTSSPTPTGARMPTAFPGAGAGVSILPCLRHPSITTGGTLPTASVSPWQWGAPPGLPPPPPPPRPSAAGPVCSLGVGKQRSPAARCTNTPGGGGRGGGLVPVSPSCPPHCWRVARGPPPSPPGVTQPSRIRVGTGTSHSLRGGTR